MKELLDVFGALAALINKYGVVVILFSVGIGILAFRFDKVWSGLGSIGDKIFPVWADRRRLEIAMRQHEIDQIKIQAESEREQARRDQAIREKRELDTIIVLKDMLLAYKSELDDTKLERKQLANRLYEIVEGYERRDAQVVEVLRDMSGLIRSQTARLDQVCRMVEKSVKED